MAANVLSFVPISRSSYRVHHTGRVSIGDLLQNDDGFFVYFANPQVTGYIPEHVLRELADKLRDLNADWAARIEYELNSQPVPLIPSMADLDLPDPFVHSKRGEL